MHSISTPEAAAPLGHYSQAVAHNGLLFISTQLPIEPGRSPDAGASAVSVMSQVSPSRRWICDFSSSAACRSGGPAFADSTMVPLAGTIAGNPHWTKLGSGISGGVDAAEASELVIAGQHRSVRREVKRMYFLTCR